MTYQPTTLEQSHFYVNMGVRKGVAETLSGHVDRRLVANAARDWSYFYAGQNRFTKEELLCIDMANMSTIDLHMERRASLPLLRIIKDALCKPRSA